MSDSVLLQQTDHCATITLNRASNHNAFDAELIANLHAILDSVAANPTLRALVLTGVGSSFSAGADLHWMRAMATATEAANHTDALALAQCLRRLHTLNIPTIARVNGSAYGGGVGLIACCDIAIAVDSAKFTLSEVKLGLVPAVISPYVIEAIGKRQAQRFFLSAEIFDAHTAKHIGLVHESVSADQLDPYIERILYWISKGGPKAQACAKQLIQHYNPAHNAEQMRMQDNNNALCIAQLRASDEGQEGLSAFLNKRPASWIQS